MLNLFTVVLSSLLPSRGDFQNTEHLHKLYMSNILHYKQFTKKNTSTCFNTNKRWNIYVNVATQSCIQTHTMQLHNSLIMDITLPLCGDIWHAHQEQQEPACVRIHSYNYSALVSVHASSPTAFYSPDQRWNSRRRTVDHTVSQWGVGVKLSWVMTVHWQ